jgi:beta-lactamase class D
MGGSLLDKIKFKIKCESAIKFPSMHKKKKKKSKTDATPIASKECTGSIPEARKTDCKSKLDDLKEQHLDQEGSINHFSQSDPLKISPLPQVDVLKDLNESLKKHGLSMAAPTSEPEAVIHPCLQTEHLEPIFLGMHDEGDLHSLPGE